MPLNINFQQIFLHLFNFVLLFAILYFLLYNPVKQFMSKREEYFKNLDDQAKEKLSDAEKVKAEYDCRLKAVETEINDERAKAHKELDNSLAIRKQQAEDEASKIISDAKATARREKEKMMKEAQGEIADMVATAAEKIISAGNTSDAFDQFLAAAQRGDNNE